MKNHPILTAVGAIVFCVVGLPALDTLSTFIQTKIGLKIADGQIIQQQKQLELNRIVQQIQKEDVEHQKEMGEYNLEPVDTRVIGFEVPSQEEEYYETDRKNK